MKPKNGNCATIELANNRSLAGCKEAGALLLANEGSHYPANPGTHKTPVNYVIIVQNKEKNFLCRKVDLEKASASCLTRVARSWPPGPGLDRSL